MKIQLEVAYLPVSVNLLPKYASKTVFPPLKILLNTVHTVCMSLLHPRNRRQEQRTQYTHARRKYLPQPKNCCSTGPEEFHYLVQLIQVLLALNVVFSVVGRVYELEFRGKLHIGLVKGHEEEGEYLADIDEEDRGFLVEFVTLNS